MKGLVLLAVTMVAAVSQTAAQQPKCASDDYDCKIALQTRTIQDDPNNAEAYFNRAMAYQNKQDFVKAKADLDKYLSFKNDNADYVADGYSERGWTFYKMQDYPSALADFSKAIATNPKNSSAYFRRGVVYAAQEKWQLALDNYDASFKLNPDEVETYYNRGRAYQMLGSYDKAVGEYTTYIGMNSAKLDYAADGYRGRGTVYNLQGKYDMAVADLTKAIQFDPKKAGSYTERAKAYRKLGKTAEAAADEAKAKTLK